MLDVKEIITDQINRENGMGNIRLYKLVLSLLKNEELVKKFLISQGFKNWEINKIKYYIEYNKKRYINNRSNINKQALN